MARLSKGTLALMALVVGTLVVVFRHQEVPDEQPVPLALPTSTSAMKQLSPSDSVELPNGPPGLHATFTMATASEYFVPLSLRGSRRALDRIYDTVDMHCDAQGNNPHADGVLATLLGRTRLSVELYQCNAHVGSEVETLRGWLRIHAPSWYVWERNLVQHKFIVKRRTRMFTFCIGGGNDGRANYVEATWGQRTPIQWYTDRWTDELRPIVDLHPHYVKDPFNLLTFKISRIWQRVHRDYGSGEYDWFVRLWDDNYFLEENAHNVLGRMNLKRPTMVGKIGWRNMGKAAIFPFAGGGAGWFLNKAALNVIGPSIPQAEQWFFDFRARRDIFLKHQIHDEDVFLTAWFHIKNVSFMNAPGLEHVSPGNEQKQRCMPDDLLYRLRWKDDEAIYFDYPAHESDFRMEDAWYAYTKPIVWHYMSPRRLLRLETLLYPQRRSEFKNDDPPRTSADFAKKGRQCYPGVPDPAPPRGKSIFETPLSDPEVQEV